MARTPRSTRALRQAPRATRQKPAISYTEPATDSEFESEEVEEDSVEEDEANNAPSNTPRSRRSLRSNSRSATKRSRPRATRYGHDEQDVSTKPKTKKRKHTRMSSSKSTPVQPEPEILIIPGNIPRWQTLPYSILVQIFEYATYPLYDERTFQPTSSLKWLLGVAGLCRSFSEPAITVLYTSPPLVPMDKAHRLVELLQSDPSSMAFKYRQKVVNLSIEVRQVAAYSLPGSGLLDLYGLIKDLPRLADLEFYDERDMKPFKHLDDSMKWNYPDSIFEALEYVDQLANPLEGHKTSPCRLRSWRWSSRLAGKKWPIEKIREIHLRPSFVGLKKVAFVNYQIPRLKKGEEDPKHEELLAGALSALERLEHLIFESSTLLNQKLMPRLPSNLRNLEITNCWEVTGDMLGEFLLTHGRQLRCLTLNHNSALSLTFLPILGEACPNLQTLRMDLQYFDAHISYHNSEPDYDQLLSCDQIPTWPSTLQIIELVNLRKWQREAAEMFFQSLLDSAGALPDLRILVLQTSINIGWRDRADFRGRWIGTLGHVFKRFCEPPKQFLKASEVYETEKSKVIEPDHKPQTPESAKRLPIRHSTRTKQATNYAESSDNSEDDHFESSPPPASAPPPRDLGKRNRATREVRTLKITAGIDGFPSSPPHTPPNQAYGQNRSSSSKDNGKGREEMVIQGMCEVVNIRIDNLRPAETQFGEGDFLDSEPEGDGDFLGSEPEGEGDWDGDDGFDDGGPYAW
ncbi:Leucine-rich repeat protein [Rutstroemia sp. NJR-2017a BVV2]|nr:Leucine-rich repeat protein [Rutstroemia sp. NJR-2017a BVV2]